MLLQVTLLPCCHLCLFWNFEILDHLKQRWIFVSLVLTKAEHFSSFLSLTAARLWPLLVKNAMFYLYLCALWEILFSHEARIQLTTLSSRHTVLEVLKFFVTILSWQWRNIFFQEKFNKTWFCSVKFLFLKL